MPQHVLIAGTKERREVSDGPEVCLDLAALTFDAGFLHLQVGEDASLLDQRLSGLRAEGQMHNGQRAADLTLGARSCP
jgi:hypothetical protein